MLSRNAVTQLLSLVGSVILLTSYVRLQYGKTTISRISYNIEQILGCCFMVLAALWTFNAGFLILNSIWILVTIGKLRYLCLDKSSPSPFVASDLYGPFAQNVSRFIVKGAEISSKHTTNT